MPEGRPCGVLCGKSIAMWEQLKTSARGERARQLGSFVAEAATLVGRVLLIAWDVRASGRRVCVQRPRCAYPHLRGVGLAAAVGVRCAPGALPTVGDDRAVDRRAPPVWRIASAWACRAPFSSRRSCSASTCSPPATSSPPPSIIVAAKFASTALIARIFLLTKPALMQIPWFAYAYGVFVPWQEALFARVRSSWAVALRHASSNGAPSNYVRSIWISAAAAASKRGGAQCSRGCRPSGFACAP